MTNDQILQSMCFHYSMSQVAQNLENRYNAPFKGGDAYKPVHHVSGFSFPLMPVVVSTSERAVRLLKWGLVPYWTTDTSQADQMRSMTLNARSESLFDKPSFRKPILSRRCLIPADGFFEWQTVDGKKIPWFIQIAGQDIFSFGGIWDYWKTPGSETEVTFSIITTEANPLMATIHNSKMRMPLILHPGEENRWLDPSLTSEEIRKMLVPYPQEGLEAWTISNLITRRGVDTNTPDVKKPFYWPGFEHPDYLSVQDPGRN